MADTNSDPNIVKQQTRDRLKSYFTRIERLTDEKKALGEDIKDIYTEAKSAGFDTKAMRKVLQLKRLSPQERQEQEALVDTYLQAVES